MLSDDPESICVRQDPSSIVVDRMMDGSKIGEFIFSIYAKSKRPDTATNQLDLYVEKLDLAWMPLTDKIQIKCEPATSPAIVSKSEQNEYTYVADFKLEYTQEV
jgi:hypothetical protein